MASVDTLHPRYGGILTGDARQQTNFAYDQHVQAAYVSYSFSLGAQVAATLGGRLEHTSLLADFRTTDSRFDRAYLTGLPGGSVQYKLSAASSLRAAYSRRITQPNIYYLNPFRDTSVPGAVSFGNPALAPELTDSYELGYTTNLKTSTFNFSASVRHTGNAIEEVRLPTDTLGIITTTFANVAATTLYQLTGYASLKPTPQWTLSAGPDVRYVVRRSPALAAGQRGFTASATLNTAYLLPQEFTVQAFFSGSLRTIELQGYGPANLYYSFSGKKTFWHKQADVVLNVSCPFNERWAARSTIVTPAFDQTSTAYAYQRAFRLSFTYRFGQEQAGRPRKNIRNDDTKPGISKQGG